MNKILKAITRALSKFDKSIPRLQSELYKEMIVQIKRLDTKGDSIAITVKNLSILTSIKNKLNRLILNDAYKAEIKEFAAAFNSVYKLQFEYWKSIESTFKPKPLLKAIRNQAITDTVQSLTTQGISANVSDAIIGILRTNITSGGSYNDLAEQLRQSLTNTPESKGILDRYIKTVASDSINQFSRQYTQIVSNDLGYTWFRYQNSDIETTRCFCDKATDKDYFHISEVPEMLKGMGCDIYKKTGLPYGMIDGTNAENFFIRAGGWNCRHSIQPVADRQVPQALRDAIGTEKVEDVPKEKSFVPAKTVAEAEEWANNHFKQFNKDGTFKADFEGMPLDVINQQMQQLQKLASEYKIDGFRGISASDFKKEMSAGVTHFDKDFVLEYNNRDFSSKEKIIRDEIMGTKYGDKVKVDDDNMHLRTSTHEFAHFFGSENQRKFASINFMQAKKEIQKVFTDYKKASLNYTDNEFISHYALTKRDEFMAEAFAMYKLNSSPSSYAVSVGRIIDKYFKR